MIQIIESIQNNIYNQLANNDKIKTKEKNATKIFEAIKSINLFGGVFGGKILIFSGSDIKNLEMMNHIKDENDLENESEEGYNKNLERAGKKLGQLGIQFLFSPVIKFIYLICIPRIVFTSFFPAGEPYQIFNEFIVVDERKCSENNS